MKRSLLLNRKMFELLICYFHHSEMQIIRVMGSRTRYQGPVLVKTFYCTYSFPLLQLKATLSLDYCQMDNLSSPSQNQAILSHKQKLNQLRLSIKSKLKIYKKNSLSDSGTSDSLNSDLFPAKTKARPFLSMQSLPLDTMEPTAIFQSKYEILDKIGEGANGVVLRCLHKQTNEKYAVKKISFEVENLRSIKEYFRYVRDIDHPSIIKYKSLYISLNLRKAYLVMQLFEHSDLQIYEVKKQEELKDIAEKLLLAVSYLHGIGVCHRDIKPANLLYDPMDKQIKLIDFGISKRTKIGKLTQELVTGTGTLQYKAPQMVKGGQYTEIVDEWAVGITLYKLVTGVTPFESEYITQTIQNIEKRQINFQDKIWGQYSVYFKQLIQKLLAPVQTRITANQALKHLWFTNNLSPTRVSILKRRGLTSKETMMVQVNGPKQKMMGKFSIPEVEMHQEEESHSPSKIAKKMIQQELVEGDKICETSAQYDSENQQN